MGRKGVVSVLLGVVVLALFAAVASSDQVTYITRLPDVMIEPESDPELRESEAELQPDETFVRERLEIPSAVDAAIRAFVVICCIVAAVVVATLAWRHRPRLRWRRRRPPPSFETLPDVAEAVADDADEQLAILRSGTPRNAIVECWLRLEATVDAAGFARRPSDTSTELVERVLAESLVDDVALARLAGLYREARFSDHQLGEDRRSEAIAWLAAVHDDLRRSRAMRDTSPTVGTR